ncbi:MAG: hypothetical protein AAGC78_14560 [Cellvibrio sp.]|uniref:hypothetical protein n=1 Tax=Cellvibrio sp. TaxID=1965322 RepID=UPI0031A66972
MQQSLLVTSLLLSALLVGCGGSSNIKSTMPIDLHDSNADAVFLQAKTTLASGRKIHLEVEQHKVNDTVFLSSGGEDGRYQYRLHDGNPNGSAVLVGPAIADTSQKITQISAHANYSLVDTRRFKMGWAPHVSYLFLDSAYRTPGKAVKVDMDKPGLGAQLNLGFIILPQLSLNLAGKFTHFTSDTTNFTHNVFVRYQPTPQLNIDIGKYVGTLDVNEDSGVIYEQRAANDPNCFPNCVYEFNGKKPSRLEIDNSGFRVGLGWSFD